LGVALVKGYEDMGFEMNLSKPFLRKEVSLQRSAVRDHG
jgi:DNA topoisomerase-3